MLAYSIYACLACKAGGLVGQSVNDFAFRVRLNRLVSGLYMLAINILVSVLTQLCLKLLNGEH